MSDASTRPPLFDPEPSDSSGPGDSEEKVVGYPLRPPRGSSKKKSDKPKKGGASSSPKWVRPFIVGGLIILAGLSVVSFLNGNDDTPRGMDTPSSAGAETATATEDNDAGVNGAPLAASEAPDALAEEPATVEGTNESSAGAPGTETENVTSDETAPTVAEASGGPTTPSSNPEALQFAVQFAQVYLNLLPDPVFVQARSDALANFVVAGLDPALGDTGGADQRCPSVIGLGTRTDGERTIASVSGYVTGDRIGEWVYLDVPMMQDTQGRWAVIAPPAYVAAPRPGTPQLPELTDVEPALTEVLQSKLLTFFNAYGGQEQVQIPGLTASEPIPGLGGRRTLESIDNVRVVSIDDNARTVHVELMWRDLITNSIAPQQYQVTVIPEGSEWLITSVTG